MGWKGESRRHSLSRKGIKTAQSNGYVKKSKGLGKVTSPNQKATITDNSILINGEIKYNELADHDLKRTFISKEEYHHPDGFDYVIGIEIIDSYYATGDEDLKDKYWVVLNLIPKMTGENRADLIKDMPPNPDETSIYNEAMDYGYSIKLRDELAHKDELDDHIKELALEGNLVPSLSGFYLDKPQNRIGDTGWDRLGEWGVMGAE